MTKLRVSTILVALLLSTNVALASPGNGDSSAASASGGASHSFVGLLSGIGIAGAAAGASLAFHNNSTRERMAVTKAPEISMSGALSGMILLLGGALVIRGRRQVSA